MDVSVSPGSPSLVVDLDSRVSHGVEPDWCGVHRQNMNEMFCLSVLVVSFYTVLYQFPHGSHNHALNKLQLDGFRSGFISKLVSELNVPQCL